MKKIFLSFLYFIILIFLIIFISVTIFRYFSKYDTCRLLNIFEKDTYEDKHLFSSYGLDPYRFCSFSLSETENNLKGFGKIDEKYFENDKIKFAFKNLDSFIKDDAKEYIEEEKIFLKNMKDILKKWEKEEDVFYKYFKIYKDLEDFEICYYKKSENKGYCIVNHM